MGGCRIGALRAHFSRGGEKCGLAGKALQESRNRFVNSRVQHFESLLDKPFVEKVHLDVPPYYWIEVGVIPPQSTRGPIDVNGSGQMICDGKIFLHRSWNRSTARLMPHRSALIATGGDRRFSSAFQLTCAVRSRRRESTLLSLPIGMTVFRVGL